MGKGHSLPNGPLSKAYNFADYKESQKNLSTKAVPKFSLFKSDKKPNDPIIQVVRQRKQLQKVELLRERVNKGFPNLCKIGFDQTQPGMCGGAKQLQLYSEFRNKDLQSAIRTGQMSRETFSGQTVQKVAFEVLKTLNGLNSVGMEHGNIRPCNIFHSQKGEVRLLDSAVLSGQSAYSIGQESGQLKYLSPQQIQNLKRKLDEPKGNQQKSDVFALGLVLFQMLSLKDHSVLSDSGYKAQSLERQMAGLSGDYSFELLDKVRLMLQIDPDRRKSAAQMLKMFERMALRKAQLYEH